jgi:hypothetical protein
MAINRGAKRYQHTGTNEVKYFQNEPDNELWVKVGTPGSKNWMWIHNATEERYIKKTEVLPEGFALGRLKI